MLPAELFGRQHHSQLLLLSHARSCGNGFLAVAEDGFLAVAKDGFLAVSGDGHLPAAACKVSVLYNMIKCIQSSECVCSAQACCTPIAQHCICAAFRQTRLPQTRWKLKQLTVGQHQQEAMPHCMALWKSHDTHSPKPRGCMCHDVSPPQCRAICGAVQYGAEGLQCSLFQLNPNLLMFTYCWQHWPGRSRMRSGLLSCLLPVCCPASCRHVLSTAVHCRIGKGALTTCTVQKKPKEARAVSTTEDRGGEGGG